MTALSATALGGEARARRIRGLGALVLAAALVFVWDRLVGVATLSLVGGSQAPIARLAVRNGAHNPGRSTLTVGLIGCREFFDRRAQCVPARLGQRPATDATAAAAVSTSWPRAINRFIRIWPPGRPRRSRLFRRRRQAADQCDIVPLRVCDGDDASCLNLYRPTEPRLWESSSRSFVAAGSRGQPPPPKRRRSATNPWLLLDKQLPPEADGSRRRAGGARFQHGRYIVCTKARLARRSPSPTAKAAHSAAHCRAC